MSAFEARACRVLWLISLWILARFKLKIPLMSWLGRIFKENPRQPNPPGIRPVSRPKTGPATPVASTQKPSEPVAAPEEIRLELSVFYPRIPPEFLKAGPADLTRVLKFKIAEIRTLITQGKLTIPLSRIAEQVPEIFSVSISSQNDVEVFFPWKRVAHLVGAPEIGSEKNSGFDGQPEAPARDQIVGHPPSKSPFTRTWSNRPKTEALPPIHLREGTAEDAIMSEQKRAALHARKRAWFRNNAEAKENQQTEGGQSVETLRKEIEALRGELIKTQQERDEALAALGLSAPEPEKPEGTQAF